jgi:DNA (cytosine-5)-methyltransferase 1
VWDRSQAAITTERKLLIVPRSLEICAGAGGTAIGLERAGFKHVGLVENDAHACVTLRHNRPKWNVLEADVRTIHAADFPSFDLLSGGVPCPPFSKAGRQLGPDDERDLFPEVIRLADEGRPKAIMVENVRGLLDPVFADYRRHVQQELDGIGYWSEFKMLNASDYGVPQLRPRVILVGLQHRYAERFRWPEPKTTPPPTVGEALYDEISSAGWPGADAWREVACTVAPTLVGGSKKHGGPDLGPTRARQAWAKLGVEGRTIADKPPGPDHEGMPRLTVKMASLLQGFPSEWEIVGKKTQAYRQVGNAFPPPVAEAVARSIKTAIRAPRKAKSEAEAAA